MNKQEENGIKKIELTMPLAIWNFFDSLCAGIETNTDSYFQKQFIDDLYCQIDWFVGNTMVERHAKKLKALLSRYESTLF